MPKLEKDGFKRFWPLRQNMGQDRQGRRLYREIFRDMTTGEICGGGVNPETGQEKGWNGEPEGKPNNVVFSSNELFRKNYALIKWNSKEGGL
jgi:hypothetical protein